MSTPTVVTADRIAQIRIISNGNHECISSQEFKANTFVGEMVFSHYGFPILNTDDIYPSLSSCFGDNPTNRVEVWRWDYVGNGWVQLSYWWKQLPEGEFCAVPGYSRPMPAKDEKDGEKSDGKDVDKDKDKDKKSGPSTDTAGSGTGGQDADISRWINFSATDWET